MSLRNQCEQCGTELPSDALGPLCPVCAAAAEPNPSSKPPVSGGAAPEGSSVRLRLRPRPPDFGDYTDLEEIACGGMGIVYKAWQVSLKRWVALKMISRGPSAMEAELRRFRTEAEAAAKVKHPNIVTVYEVGEHEGQPYISMELVEGGSLAERLEECKERNPRWQARADSSALCNPQVAIRLLLKVARAVQCAHEHKVLHRDLKPGNILIDGLGEPHLTDFGLARLLAAKSRQTMPGEVLGTLQYMAPEQAEGKTNEHPEAADIYSLGAILYELLTGERPYFEAKTPLAAANQAQRREPSPPSSVGVRVDRDLETICLKCLEIDPVRRYGSAKELADDLERWFNDLPIKARPTNLAERALKWTRRNPATAMLASMGVGGFIVLAAFGFAHWLHWRKTLADAKHFNQSLRRGTNVDWPMRERDLMGSRHVPPATNRWRIEDYAPAPPIDGVGSVFVGNVCGGKELEIVAQRTNGDIAIFSASGVLITNVPHDRDAVLACLGDVNGDGKLEIITGTDYTNAYAIKAYDSKGTVKASAQLSCSRQDMISVVMAGDFYHDGKCAILATVDFNPLKPRSEGEPQGRRGIVLARRFSDGPYGWEQRMPTDVGPYIGRARVAITMPGETPRLMHGSHGPHNRIEGNDSSYDGTSYAFSYALSTGELLWRREFQGGVLFKDSDFQSIGAFASRLLNPPQSDAISGYLWNLLSSGTKDRLRNRGLTTTDKHLEESLIQDLNRIIGTELLYSSNRFAGITLPSGLAGWLKNEHKSRALAGPNRELLAAAYSNELSSANLPNYFDANVFLPDLNGDGVPEIVVTTRQHCWSDWVDSGIGTIRELDPASGKDKRLLDLKHITENGVFGDLDGDGKDEIIIDMWDGTNGWLRAYGEGLTQKGQYKRPGGKLTPWAICGLDGDGRHAEVLASFEGITELDKLITNRWPLFRPGQITNIEAVVRRMERQEDEVARYLWKRMNANLQHFLETKQPEADKEAALDEYLNSVVEGQPLPPELFENIRRRPVTWELLAGNTNNPEASNLLWWGALKHSLTNPDQFERAYVNRHLLEDAFPGEFASFSKAKAAAEAKPAEHLLLILDHSLKECLWEKAFPEGKIDQVMVVDLSGDDSRDILVHARDQLSLLRPTPAESQPPAPKKR